jgi:hypothetical protein
VKIRLTVLSVVAASLAAAPIHAQTRSVAGGVSFERYSFGDASATGIESLTLLVLPFGAAASVTSRLNVEVNGAWARGALTRTDGSESTIQGLADTDVRARFAVIRDRLILSASYIAPTGNATQSTDESEVAGAVAADLLPFRISNWGQGGGFAADAALISRVGTTGVGLSVSYGVAGEFEPLDGEEAVYLPGNQLQVRLALDRSVGAAGKATLQLSAHRFSDDQLDSRNLYRSGNRIQGILSYAFAIGTGSSAVAWGGWMRRQRGTYLDDDEIADDRETPAQDLILIGGGLRVPVGPAALLPTVDARVFRSSDGVGQGYVAGAGLAAELRAGSLVLVPSARARFGNVLVREDTESAITGLELAATIRFGS